MWIGNKTRMVSCREWEGQEERWKNTESAEGMPERCQRRIYEERKTGKHRRRKERKEEINKDHCGKNSPKFENNSVNAYATIMCCTELQPKQIAASDCLCRSHLWQNRQLCLCTSACCWILMQKIAFHHPPIFHWKGWKPALPFITQVNWWNRVAAEWSHYSPCVVP